MKNEKKATKIKSLFIRIALATAVVFSVIVVSGLLIMRSMIKPPDIPQDIIISPKEPDTHNQVALLPPEGEEEDRYIGNGLRMPDSFTHADRKEDFYTFLIVGMDKGVNTDTIMVASYDGVNNEANVISIPRDSLVNVKRRVKKINSAYAVGTLHGGGREGGIEQLKREIKTITGFVPDFYACIDLNAFVRIVDTVNGIDIDVPYAMEYDDSGQDLHIDIKKGQQSLNGENALLFARYRRSNSGSTITDYQRMENQHAIIRAMLVKLMRPENILRISEFVEIFNENVYSDVKVENMLWFAEQINKIKGTEALSTHTLPTSGTSGLPDYYEFLDEAAIIELVNNTINPYNRDIEADDLDIITSY